LSSGNNSWDQLAIIQAELLEGFLEAIFEGDWTAVTAPTSRPMKLARIAADSTSPCEVFIRDSFSQKKRAALKKTRDSPRRNWGSERYQNDGWAKQYFERFTYRH
jgi:hypothetical protein